MVIQALVCRREASSYSSWRPSKQNLEEGMKRGTIGEDCLIHSLLDLFSPSIVITQVHLSRDCVKLIIKLCRTLTGKVLCLVNLWVSAILILCLLKWKFLGAVILLLTNMFSCLEEKHLCSCWACNMNPDDIFPIEEHFISKNCLYSSSCHSNMYLADVF